MARPLRIQYPGAFYHVMNRGSDHQNIFLRDKVDRFLFKLTLQDAVRLWKIKIHAYSLMDNHYHLLIETPLGNLSRAMRHIDGIYTQRFNRVHKRDGPLFRGRYKSIFIQKDNYFLELVRYIHLNGVRALKYKNPASDPHSSHRAYLESVFRPGWLSTDLALSYFSTKNSSVIEAKTEFDRYINQGISPTIAEIIDKNKWPAFLCTKEFLNEIREQSLSNRNPNPEIPQERELLQFRCFSSTQIFDLVSKTYQTTVENLIRASPGKANPARQAAIYFLRYEAHLSYSKIGQLMGGISDSAVEQNCLKIDKESVLFIQVKNLLAVET